MSIMPASLRLVAAGLHIAPATAVVLADVQEEPAAIFGGAGLHIMQLIRGQQVRRRTRYHPENALQPICIAYYTPIPAKFVFLRNNTGM